MTTEARANRKRDEDNIRILVNQLRDEVYCLCSNTEQPSIVACGVDRVAMILNVYEAEDLLDALVRARESE